MANPVVQGGLKYNSTILGDSPGGCVTCVTMGYDAVSQIGIGDPVKLSGDSDANGIPAIIICNTSDRIFGIVESVLPDLSGLLSEGLKYRAASTYRRLAVRPADAFTIYEIEEDNATGNLSNASVGFCANLNMSVCSTLSGLSTVRINSASAVAGPGQVRIVGFVQRGDNNISSSNGKWLVTIGLSGLADGVTGV